MLTVWGKRPKSVIYVVLNGGPSHIDTSDPKPDAPVEYRGDFNTIPTKLSDRPAAISGQATGVWVGHQSADRPKGRYLALCLLERVGRRSV